MANPVVSVVIIVRNMQDTIGECLEALMNQTLPKDKYEVVVVDNKSTDNTPKIVKKYPVKLVFEEQVGNYGRARNTGIKASRGDFIAFTDADCMPESDWLDKILRMHDSFPEYSGIGGAAANLFQKNKVARTIAYAQAGHWSVRAPKRVVEYLPGCNSSYRRNSLERVGLFPEATASEDIRLGAKMREDGQVLLFDPDPKVKHMFEKTLKKLAEKEERSGKGHFDMTSQGRQIVSWMRLGGLVLFSPLFMLGRVGRGLNRVILYSDSKADVFVLMPYLIYSGFFWTRGYLRRAFQSFRTPQQA